MENNGLLTVEEFEEQIKQMEKQLKRLRKSPYIPMNEIEQVEEGLKQLSLQTQNLKMLEQLPLKKSEEIKVKRHHIKPWKDPESLFCDTEFLEKLLRKKVSTRDECNDRSNAT